MDQAEFNTLLPANQSLSRNDRRARDNRTRAPPFGVSAAAPRLSLDRRDFERRWIIYFICAEAPTTYFNNDVSIAVSRLLSVVVHQESQVKVFLVLWKSEDV